jgi:hypothetical protein
MIAALLGLGLAGTATELVLLDHVEGFSQVIPLVLIGLALAALGWDLMRPRSLTVRAFRAVMALLVASGVLGVALHFSANLGFQLEVDPQMSRGELIWKALHATAPPALAPGIMVQLGLLGLIYTYRHPALREPSINGGSL